MAMAQAAVRHALGGELIAARVYPVGDWPPRQGRHDLEPRALLGMNQPDARHPRRERTDQRNEQRVERREENVRARMAHIDSRPIARR